MSADAPTPRDFYTERIPAQWNAALREQAALGEDGRRVYEGMRAVDATIRVDVEGPGGGRFFLNITAGEMSAEESAAHPPFLTVVQDLPCFQRLAREAGDSVLGLLGGLSGAPGELKLTRARVRDLGDVNALVRIEVTGDDGFALHTHFGSAPMPDEPQTTIQIDGEAYRELRGGALDPQTALMSQQVRIEGDMQPAMQLALAAIARD